MKAVRRTARVVENCILCVWFCVGWIWILGVCCMETSWNFEVGVEKE